MRIFLRSLALSVACAVTGATTALLVVALTTAPAPTCPDAPVLEIHPYLAPPSPPPPAPPAPAIEPPQIPPGAVHCDTEDRCRIDAALLDTVIHDTGIFASPDTRIMPAIKDGVRRGLKLYAIRPGSLPGLLGIKNGDLLTAVNGVPVTDLTGFFTQLDPRTYRTFALDLERKGQPIQRHIRID